MLFQPVIIKIRDRDERYRSPGQTNRWLYLVDYKASGSVTFNNITVVELQKMRSESGYARQSVQLESAVEKLHFLFGNYPEGISKRVLPMIILLELMLPKIDEHEVLGEIKSKKPTKLIPVVILTSSKEEEDVLKDYDLGANGYVCKPVDYQGFVEVANNLGVYWLAINQSYVNEK